MNNRDCTIGELELFCGWRPVYRRSDGSIWMKLNNDTQIRAKKAEFQQKRWVSEGSPTSLNPNEIVEVLHFANEQVGY
jgi:hypothetical protein